MTLATVYKRVADLPETLIRSFQANAARATRDANGCLIWPRAVNQHGYGRVAWRTPDGSRNIGAHRLAMLIEHGEIPDGLVIDHLCRTRACIDTSHMRITTVHENVRAGAAGTTRQPVTQCPQGHAYEGDNVRTEVRRNGLARICRACSRESSARYKAAKRAEQN